MIYKNQGYGFINKYGEEIIPPVYIEAQQFIEGAAAVQNEENKWGYINTSGEIVIPLIYDAAYIFSGDNAVVKQDEKYGVIDKTGNTVTPFEYDYIAPFLTDGLRVAGLCDGEK